MSDFKEKIRIQEAKATEKLNNTAPELLEALQEAVKLLRIEGWRDSDSQIKLMLKAISKATQ